LEIGSGWAGMAMCLAEAEEVEATGVMLREEQLQVSRNRAVRPRKFRPADALRHTLLTWRERCVARKAEAIALYDERFFRIWEFYLAVSGAHFVTTVRS
jgi:cyclopropane fatty-acyl-phospholipid synthase-like methyltransferase